MIKTERGPKMIHMSNYSFAYYLFGRRSREPRCFQSLWVDALRFMISFPFLYRVRSTVPFSFPREPCLRLQWVNAVGRQDWTPTKNSAVCSAHFRNVDFDRTSLSRVRLREGAVPVTHPSVRAQQVNPQVVVLPISVPGLGGQQLSFPQVVGLPGIPGLGEQQLSTDVCGTLGAPIAPVVGVAHPLLHIQQEVVPSSRASSEHISPAVGVTHSPVDIQQMVGPSSILGTGGQDLSADACGTMGALVDPTAQGTSCCPLDPQLSGVSTGLGLGSTSVSSEWPDTTAPSLFNEGEASPEREGQMLSTESPMGTSTCRFTHSTPSTSRHDPVVRIVL
ncbi:uncharacterized protein LOC135395788 [Ornithodoros turicata]|uniref:uncharacterized protein LOC135395788 n=1 Tax=Ornithodoros turicata TaxID=34597 RepID=UPI0031390730